MASITATRVYRESGSENSAGGESARVFVLTTGRRPWASSAAEDHRRCCCRTRWARDLYGYQQSLPHQCAVAALVNGTTGHAVEMDDDHRTSVLHPAVAVVPAALAAAELKQAGGAEVIEGVVAGYEAMTRIGDAFLGTQYYEGFHPTGTCGVFGAAAAAGSILGLSTDQLIAAFGIAGTQAAGLEEWKADGSWIKRLHPGKAAESGLLAVLLAQSGYTGPATILEGENGFLKAFSFERKWDVNKILDGLGTEYRGYGTSFKPYAGCRFFHQVIDATLDLVREHKIDAPSVDEVVVRIYRTAYLTYSSPNRGATGPARTSMRSSAFRMRLRCQLCMARRCRLILPMS